VPGFTLTISPIDTGFDLNVASLCVMVVNAQGLAALSQPSLTAPVANCGVNTIQGVIRGTSYSIVGSQTPLYREFSCSGTTCVIDAFVPLRESSGVTTAPDVWYIVYWNNANVASDAASANWEMSSGAISLSVSPAPAPPPPPPGNAGSMASPAALLLLPSVLVGVLLVMQLLV